MDGKGKIWIMKRNSKLVLYGYRSLIFFVLLLSGVCVINMLQGESWRLFFYDLKRGFADNREFMKKFAVLLILLTGWIIWSEWGITGRVRLKWRIQVGKYQCEYYNCKYLDQLYIPTIVIALILVSCILWQMINDFHAAESSAWEGTVTIGHSFGEIDGRSYTGSLEAFQYNYEKGLRVFEVDMEITSDDKVVLRHDWNQKIQEGISSADPPTQERFLSIPILGEYTPLSFEDLCGIMREYPDIWIVTDTKYKDPEMVNKQFTIMKETALKADALDVFDRFIVQLYSEEMHEVVEAIYPFESYIFTMYQRWFGDDEAEFTKICRWSYEHNVDNIAMGWDLVNTDILEICNRYHLDVYVNTVNKADEAKQLLKDGVKGIYTDRLSASDFKED